MRTLIDFAGEILDATKDRQDFDVPLQDLVNSMRPIDSTGKNYVVDSEVGEVVLTKGGFNQLVKDRLGGTPAIFNDKQVSLATKKAYLMDKAQGLDKRVLVRIGEKGIDGVLSEQYSLFSNKTIMEIIVGTAVTNPKILPQLDQLFVQGAWLSKDGRNLHMRVISPDNWNFKINGATYYTSIGLVNNEIGLGSFKIQPAIAKVSCFNYVLAESIFDHNHRISTTEEMTESLGKSFLLVFEYAKRMKEQMEYIRNIQFDRPEVVFQLMSQRLGLSERVTNDALEYWDNEGGETVFDVVQAITFGVQDYSERGRKNWTRREEVERAIWDWSGNMLELHQAGADVNQWVSEAELVSKRKVVAALKDEEKAKSMVINLEPDAWQ